MVTDKPGAADQKRTWASFKNERDDKVTLASIFARAKEHGWEPPRRKHRKCEKTADGFVRGDGDQILRGRPDNIKHAIALLGVTLRQNDFSSQVEIAGLPKFGPHLDDAGVTSMRFWVHEKYGFLPPLDLFEQAITDIAHANRHHSVRTYLEGLVWDGREQLGAWLSCYVGAPKSLYTETTSESVFSSGLWRAYSGPA